jgi:glycosyltransferase involved in cell wall biosynthesis
MKIAVFTHNYPSSKSELKNAGIFVYYICQQLAQKNEVWVFCPHETKKGISKVGKTNVFWLKRGTSKPLGTVSLSSPLGLISISFFFLRAILALPRFANKSQKPDVCIAMWAWPSGFFTLFYKIMFKTPYVVWALGSDINKYSKMPLMKNVMAAILKEAGILYTDGIKLTRDVKKISHRNCYFLPSSTKVDAPKLQKRKENKIVISFLGRMEPVKGPDIFLNALIKNKDELSNFHFNFIGDGNLFKQLQKKAKENKINFATTFYPSDRKRNMHLLAKSDWVIIPSRDDSIPLVFSEAMKLGQPIIASDLPDISHLIKKYKVGLTFKKENSKDLARVIKSLTKSKALRKQFQKNTQKAAKDFSVEESANKLYNGLQKISKDVR